MWSSFETFSSSSKVVHADLATTCVTLKAMTKQIVCNVDQLALTKLSSGKHLQEEGVNFEWYIEVFTLVLTIFRNWSFLPTPTPVIPYELNQGSQVSYFGLQTLLPWRLYANYRDKVIPFVSHMQMTLYTYGNQFHEIFNSATRSWSTWRTFNT